MATKVLNEKHSGLNILVETEEDKLKSTRVDLEKLSRNQNRKGPIVQSTNTTVNGTVTSEFNAMVKNGTAMCRWFLDNMSEYDAERDICLYIYSKTNAIFNRMIDQERVELGEMHEDQQKSNQLLQHPLAATFLDKHYNYGEIPRVPREYSALMQLDIFFPIHYKAGNRVEAALRKGASLNRQQVIILWAIAAQGVDGEKMERKLIEQTLKDWLEITSSSVSKAIRSLTDPPLNILTITENPASGREKIVCLTAEGKKVVQDMLSNGRDYLQDVIAELSEEEIDNLS